MSGTKGSAKTTKTTKRKAPTQADNPATSCKKRKTVGISAKTAKKTVPAELPVRGRESEMPARGKAAQETEKQENSSKAHQRRTLSKGEKLNVVENEKTYSCGTLLVIALTAVRHQLPLNANDELKQFCTSVPVSSLHFFLSEQLKKHFIDAATAKHCVDEKFKHEGSKYC